MPGTWKEAGMHGVFLGKSGRPQYQEYRIGKEKLWELRSDRHFRLRHWKAVLRSFGEIL